MYSDTQIHDNRHAGDRNYALLEIPHSRVFITDCLQVYSAFCAFCEAGFAAAIEMRTIHSNRRFGLGFEEEFSRPDELLVMKGFRNIWRRHPEAGMLLESLCPTVKRLGETIGLP